MRWIVAILVSASVASSAAEASSTARAPLRKWIPQYTGRCQPGLTIHEKRLPPSIAGAVGQAVGAGPDMCLRITSVPGRPGVFLVVASAVSSGRGARLVVVRREGFSYRVVTRSQSPGPEVELRPVFLYRENMIYVLAEQGTDYPLGYRVYKLTAKDGLRDLGELPVVLEPNASRRAGSATRTLTGALERGSVVIEFRTSIVVETRGLDNVRHERRGTWPISFKTDGNTFSRVR